jgi:hypothetical protein
LVGSTRAQLTDRQRFAAAKADSLVIIEEFNLKISELSRQASTVSLTPLQIQLVAEIVKQSALLVEQALTGQPLNTALLSVLVNAASALITPSTTARYVMIV